MKAKYINPFTDFGFKKIFGEEAELAKLGPADLERYEYSLKIFRDNKNTYDYAVDTAFDEGKMEGILEGKMDATFEVARNLKALGIPLEIIIKTTGLSASELEQL